MRRRWTVRCVDIAGDEIARERFWRRRTALLYADIMQSPLYDVVLTYADRRGDVVDLLIHEHVSPDVLAQHLRARRTTT